MPTLYDELMEMVIDDELSSVQESFYLKLVYLKKIYRILIK